MFGELGSMTVRSRTPARLIVCLSRATAVVGWAVALAAVVAAFALVAVSTWLAAVAVVLALAGWLAATARHRLEFDRDDGVVRIERHVAGLGTRAVVPLFHLRAVTVKTRSGGRGFVAALERRSGGSIEIDHGDRAAPLYELARAIADVTELRLVYDTTRS
jgi:hypothetical protein